MTYTFLDRTGSASVSFAGEVTLTGSRSTAGYRVEAERDLLDRAPLPSGFREPLHKWADKLAGTPSADLLADLHSRFGLEWRRIARLLGVSVRAVNKWREGGGLSPDRDQSLRELVAFCEVAVGEGVGDVAAWMASRPISAIPVQRADLYAAGAVDRLLDSFGGPLSTDVIDRFVPGWRDKQALETTPLHLQVRFGTDGDVLVDVQELPGVFGVGPSLLEARRSLVGALRDYVADWVDDLHEAPNHAPYEDVVNLIRGTSDEDLVRYLHGDS